MKILHFNTTELIIVRHMETKWNLEERLQGQKNSELSPEGIKKLPLLAKRFSKENFHSLYSSDLERAMKTAEAISGKTGHKIISASGLRERNFGIFEGLTRPEIEERFPADARCFYSRDPDYVIPNGESRSQGFERVVKCLDDIAMENIGKRIVIVTHGGVIAGFLRHALHIPFESKLNCKMLNGSINIFLWTDKVLTLALWGDVSHLK